MPHLLFLVAMRAISIYGSRRRFPSISLDRPPSFCRNTNRLMFFPQRAGQHRHRGHDPFPHLHCERSDNSNHRDRPIIFTRSATAFWIYDRRWSQMISISKISNAGSGWLVSFVPLCVSALCKPHSTRSDDGPTRMSFIINRFWVAMQYLLSSVGSAWGSVCNLDCLLPFVKRDRPCHQKVGRRHFEATGVRYIAFLYIFVALSFALNSLKMTTEKVWGSLNYKLELEPWFDFTNISITWSPPFQ